MTGTGNMALVLHRDPTGMERRAVMLALREPELGLGVFALAKPPLSADLAVIPKPDDQRGIVRLLAVPLEGADRGNVKRGPLTADLTQFVGTWRPFSADERAEEMDRVAQAHPELLMNTNEETS